MGALFAIRSAVMMVMVLLIGGLVVWFVIRVFVDLVEWFREDIVAVRRLRKMTSQRAQRTENSAERIANPSHNKESHNKEQDEQEETSQ